jgi:hypothetical protein
MDLFLGLFLLLFCWGCVGFERVEGLTALCGIRPGLSLLPGEGGGLLLSQKIGNRKDRGVAQKAVLGSTRNPGLKPTPSNIQYSGA